MSDSVPICTMDPELKAQLRAFRFRKEKTNQAIVMKIDVAKRLLVVDEVLDDLETIEELRDELPEHQPRFAVYSFKLVHDDGRVSFPMILIFSTPRDCKTELQVMYAGTKLSLVKEAELTKVYEIRDLDELDDEWLFSKLKK